MANVKSTNEISSVEKQVATLNGKLKEDTPKILDSFIRTTLEQMNKEFNEELAKDEEYLRLKKAVADYKQNLYENSDFCKYAQYTAGKFADYAAKVYKFRYGCKMPENSSTNERLAKIVKKCAADTEARIISAVCQFNDTFETKIKKTKQTDTEKVAECAKELAKVVNSDYPQDIKEMSLLGLKSKYGANVFEQAKEQASK